MCEFGVEKLDWPKQSADPMIKCLGKTLHCNEDCGPGLAVKHQYLISLMLSWKSNKISKKSLLNCVDSGPRRVKANTAHMCEKAILFE